MDASPAARLVPSTAELSTTHRDLRFYPTTTEHPKTLASEQIAAFNRNGYLAPFRIFGEAEIADIRRYFDDLLARTLAAGGDSYSKLHLHGVSAADALRDSRADKYRVFENDDTIPEYKHNILKTAFSVVLVRFLQTDLAWRPSFSCSRQNAARRLR